MYGMSDKELTVMTIKMTKDERQQLREIAKRLGFTVGRGREADWGSVRQLMLAIADGDLAVVASSSEMVTAV